jgi:YVTN family beta-propeller protein
VIPSSHLHARASRGIVVAVAVIGALIATAVAVPAQAVGPVGTYSVGTEPKGIAVTLDGTKAYVSNTGDFSTPGNTVTVLNLVTGTTITTLTVGSGPQAAVLNPAGTKVYVANRVSGTVSVISTASNTVTNTITVGVGAFGIAFTPDGTKAFVSRYSAAGIIDVIDTSTETNIASITDAPAWSEGVAVSPNGLTLYATGSNNDALYLINANTYVVSATSYPVGHFPTSVRVSPEGLSVYVVNEGATNSTVSVFDAAGLSVVNTIPAGDYPTDMVVSADGSRGYVTSTDNDVITVMDLFTETVLTTINSGIDPWAIALSADGRTVVATDRGSNAVTHYSLSVDRISGADRYSTAVAISQASFPSPAAVPYVFVATGSNYPDALAAGPLAASLAGPLLLTASDSLPSVVAAEVARLNPAKIVVIGGEGAVSASVYSQLAAIQSDIERIAGTDRYDTGRDVVEFGFASAGEVWIATGQNYPDALSAGAVGAGTGYPVVLVDGLANSIDSATLALLTTLGPLTIKIAGGTGAVSSGIETQLSTVFSSATVERFAGATRYETSLAINAQAYGYADYVLLATGEGFPDALAGAPLAGSLGSPLLVVPPGCLPAASRTQIDRVTASQVTLLGGTGALSPAVFDLTVCG